MSKLIANKKKKEIIDERLLPMANGLDISLNKSDVYNLNFPNYNECDIIVQELVLKADAYDNKIHGNEVEVYGKCDFTGSTFPEATWEHMPGNLFQIMINQIGKASQSVTTTVNGIALRSSKSENRRPATPNNITFTKKSRVFIKAKQVFVRAYFEFFENNIKVAKYETLSVGVERDYTEMIKQKESVDGLLIAYQVVTPKQLERLYLEKEKLKGSNAIISIGDLAIKNGLCTEEQVNACLIKKS